MFNLLLVCHYIHTGRVDKCQGHQNCDTENRIKYLTVETKKSILKKNPRFLAYTFDKGRIMNPL